MLGLQRRRADADAARVPPGADARLEHLLGGAPADEVVGAGEQDLAVAAAELGLRAVEEHPAAVDPVRQQRGVLVLRVPDDPVALDRSEVLGGREEDGGAGRAVRGAGDDPAVELVDPDGACVLEAPLLGRDLVVGCEQRLGIDRPAVDAVGRAGDGELRDASAVLDPGEQDGLAVDARRRRVEDGVDGIRPVRRP